MKNDQVDIQKEVDTAAELFAQIVLQQVMMKKMIKTDKRMDTEYEKPNK